MFQDRCRRVVRNKAHFHGTLSSTTFPAAARQKPHTRCTNNGRLHFAFWRIRARRQSLIPGFEMGTQMFKVFSCSVQTWHLPALTASVRTTSRNASWSRMLSSNIVQTTSRTIVKVRRSTLKIPNTTFSLTLWTDTSKGMTTSTSPLDISNLTRHCSTLPPKTAPTKKITIQTPAPPDFTSGATQNTASISSSAGSSSNPWTSSL